MVMVFGAGCEILEDFELPDTAGLGQPTDVGADVGKDSEADTGPRLTRCEDVSLEATSVQVGETLTLSGFRQAPEQLAVTLTYSEGPVEASVEYLEEDGVARVIPILPDGDPYGTYQAEASFETSRLDCTLSSQPVTVVGLEKVDPDKEIEETIQALRSFRSSFFDAATANTLLEADRQTVPAVLRPHRMIAAVAGTETHPGSLERALRGLSEKSEEQRTYLASVLHAAGVREALEEGGRTLGPSRSSGPGDLHRERCFLWLTRSFTQLNPASGGIAGWGEAVTQAMSKFCPAEDARLVTDQQRLERLACIMGVQSQLQGIKDALGSATAKVWHALLSTGLDTLAGPCAPCQLVVAGVDLFPLAMDAWAELLPSGFSDCPAGVDFEVDMPESSDQQRRQFLFDESEPAFIKNIRLQTSTDGWTLTWFDIIGVLPFGQVLKGAKNFDELVELFVKKFPEFEGKEEVAKEFLAELIQELLDQFNTIADVSVTAEDLSKSFEIQVTDPWECTVDVPDEKLWNGDHSPLELPKLPVSKGGGGAPARGIVRRTEAKGLVPNAVGKGELVISVDEDYFFGQAKSCSKSIEVLPVELELEAADRSIEIDPYEQYSFNISDVRNTDSEDVLWGGEPRGQLHISSGQYTAPLVAGEDAVSACFDSRKAGGHISVADCTERGTCPDACVSAEIKVRGCCDSPPAAGCSFCDCPDNRSDPRCVKCTMKDACGSEDCDIRDGGAMPICQACGTQCNSSEPIPVCVCGSPPMCSGKPSCCPSGEGYCEPDVCEAPSCQDKGAECGALRVDTSCGWKKTLNCGSCGPNAKCRDNKCCELTPGDQLCAQEGADCGTIRVEDNCGIVREVDCGTCEDDDDVCLQNQCCSPESDEELCQLHGVECGPLEAVDRCGQLRSIAECGPCQAGVCLSETCCQPEEKTDFCSRFGVECGNVTAPDNCGQQRTENCGSCSGANEVCQGNFCVCKGPGCSPTACRQPDSAGDVVISEFMASPSATGLQDGQWFEVHNPSDSTCYDLSGCRAKSRLFTHLLSPKNGNLEIQAGAYGTFAVSAMPGFQPDFEFTSGWGIDPQGDILSIVCGGTVVDEVGYKTGMNWMMNLPTAGKAKGLSPMSMDETANDDGANWCDQTTSLPNNADFGTPGEANDTCE